MFYVNHSRHSIFRARVVLFIAAQFAIAGQTMAETELFNPAMLGMDNSEYKNVDLSAFENGAQAPGIYRVDIFVNNQMVSTEDVTFFLEKNSSGKTTLQPCLSVEKLAELGVKVNMFPSLKKAGCAPLNNIPNAFADFVFSAQRLSLSIPQVAISQLSRGYVSPALYDNGIPALLLNYSFTGASVTARGNNGQNNNSQYANLRPGLNIGPWRIRNYTTWSRDGRGDNQWNTVYTYAQRGIVELKSQMTLGDSSTFSDVFDSVSFRGAQLASDDDMLPDTERGYAPVVRGIARSNAQVVIRQNGYEIYQAYVSPGAFEITDLYPTGGGGDLNVTVKEADGSEQQFIVPFASLPVLQREGRLKYSFTSGQYRSYDSRIEKTPFSQLTGIYGLPYGLTVYGGSQFSSKYQSLAIGVGKNLGVMGAFSLDTTQAWSTPKERAKENGQSWRGRYSKNWTDTGTYFSLAGYRYSTAGYYSLPEILDTYTTSFNSYFIERRRNRAELTVNQQLWSGGGSLSFNVYREDYWDSDKTTRSMGIGYNNGWNGISYSLNYSDNQNTGGRYSSQRNSTDRLFALNVSVPLERWMHNTWVNYTMNSSQQGYSTHSVGLNGTALDKRNLSWGVRESYADGGQGTNGNLNVDYRGTYGEIIAGYSYDSNSRRVNYGLQGSMIAHENGITLGQPLGETISLIRAPGASGVNVTNQTGVKTDYRGYAIVPYTSAYRKNDIALDVDSLSDDIELSQTNKTVIPTRGAVVIADFDAQVGYRVLMTLMRSGGKVPFGATVSNLATKKAQANIVGDEGQVYLTGLAPSGELWVKWGNDEKQSCRVNYTLPSERPVSGVYSITQQCQ
ncbi:fimbrial biogenesis outer membrane usher protein (plasmid) [Serratia ureilytica]|uniref:fimbria/pilus outer membrane usher protein n=1 Tax=Serratia ureilytica TaxID=300181 RepID=UPI001CBB2F1D|nr:fimbria/pilus outer membrane usher protein [Serratia ureilytica]UAN29733.1 fimbrial biogenesis outer membrane usher protein [Serratia ureilytica]